MFIETFDRSDNFTVYFVFTVNKSLMLITFHMVFRRVRYLVHLIFIIQFSIMIIMIIIPA